MDEGQITKRARRSPNNRSPSLVITDEYPSTNSKSDAENTSELIVGDVSGPHSNNLNVTISSTEESRNESNNASVTILSDSFDHSDHLVDYPKYESTNEKKDEFQWITPQLKDLNLSSPRKDKNTYHEDKTPAETKTQLKLVRMYLEALCCKVDDRGEILSLDCQLIRDTDMLPESDSSAYNADISKTVSPLSGNSASYIPPPPGSHAMRASIISHSSSSSIPSSAAALNIQTLLKKNTLPCNAKDPINELEKKWNNYQLVYHVLKTIDDSFKEPGITAEVIVVNPAERKNHFSFTKCSQIPPKKRTSFVLEDNENEKKKNEEPEMKKAKLSTYGENLFVFAKWIDQRYYAGFVKEQLEDKWNVEFLDGNSKNVTDEQIIFADVNSLIGHKVMLMDNSDTGKCPGIVTAFHPNEEPMYTVATDRGDFTVSAANIYLTKHQAKLVKTNLDYGESTSSSSSSIASPRTTRSRTNTYSPKPSSSGTQKTLLAKALEIKISAKNANEIGTTTDDDASDCAANGGSTNVPGCDEEMGYQKVNNPSFKLKRCHGQSSKSTIEKEAAALGPLDTKGTWFKGLGFLLTCGSRPFFDTTGDEEIATDSEDYPFTKVPYVESHLVKQIKNGGGTIYSRFEDIPSKKYKTAYLVSWRPTLTPKYIRGLAVGMRIVCHEWIVNCSINQKRLPLQELPTGWSIEHRRFIENFERRSDKPFRSLHMKIAQLHSKLFYDFWSKVCSDAGAAVSAFKGPCDSVDIILVENGLTDPSLDAAVAKGAVLISTTWVVQSLIHGETREYEKHPSYSHLYDDGEDPFET